MKVDVLSKLSIMLVAPESVTRTQVSKLFSNPRGPISNIYPKIIEKIEDADHYINEVDGVDAIIFVADALTDERQRFIDKAFGVRQIPMIVVTDDVEIREMCEGRGITHVLEPDGLEASVLGMVLNLAIEHHKMKFSMERMEDMYHNAEQRFRDVADHFSDWLWEVDRHMKLVFSSSSKRNLEGAEKGASFIKCFLPDEHSRLEDDFAELLERPQAFRDREYWAYDAYGMRTCWLVSGVPVFDRRGEVSGFRGVARDISKEKSSVDQLYYLANNDTLTGLYNRTRFTEELERITRKQARTEIKGAVILIDIDRFNYMNNTYGHQIGDRMLVHVSQVLKETLRNDDFIARVGGDDFAIVLSNVEGDDAKRRAEYMLERLHESPFRSEYKEIKLTATAGISHFPKDGETADQLLGNANVALREARARGQGRCSVYDEAQLKQHDVSRRMEQLDFVTRCLDDVENRLKLHFQPIISLKDNPSKKERYEVLLRFIDDEDAYVAPIKYIEVAEEYGLISKIDLTVCEQSLEALDKWQKLGKDITLCVNVSGRTFDDDEAMGKMADMIEKAKIKPGTFVLEITETFALKDMDKMRRLISEFKKLGVLFALDDCGVGYSSLNYIRELELDYIKIDGSFIRDLHRSADDDAFVKAIQDIAQRMNVMTVAEMVEEPETVAYLKRLGINYAQGYLFAMPAPELPEEFSELHKKAIH